MKPFVACLITFSLIHSVIAQQNLIWSKCVGGTSDDSFNEHVITRTGSIISVGSSLSNNGDFSGNHGGSRDFCIAAMTGNGTILWTKLIGGSNSDALNGAVIDTLTDGNLIVGFNTLSTDGDIIGNHGAMDIVFRKYTPTGNLLWTKTMGGTAGEDLDDIQSTPDGGFIAIGNTNSNNSGDVGPNHGAAGTSDIWIVKMDGSGTLQWQKTYGGSGADDQGRIILATGGGYYFAAATNSTDGDLTNSLPAGTSIGGRDAWLAKINASGTIIWSKQVGGSNVDDYPLVHETGTAIYLSFESNSNDRDILSNAGLYDVALFKFSLSGSLLWKNIYGSATWDAPGAMASKSDGSFYLNAVMYSMNFAGTPVFNPGGNGQILLLRIDTITSNLQWVRSIGGSQDDFSGDLSIAANGDIVMSGGTMSNDYDISGNHGNYDGVVFKISPANRIAGNVFIDNNNNGAYNPSVDRTVSYMPVIVTKQNVVQVSTISNNGGFLAEVDTGSFVTKAKPYNASYYTLVPDSFQCSFTGAYQTFSKDIQVKPVNGIRDLRVYTIPYNIARPNFRIKYLLIAYNVGTDTVSSGTISWKKDPRVTVTNYSATPNSIIGDSATWNYSSLKPFDSIRIFIDVRTPLPPALNAGDTMKYVARILPVSGDVKPIDNTLFLYHWVLGPVDPNQKMNLNAKLSLDEVQSGADVNYVIQFQNVGTAAAFDVIIKDTLSNKLQLSSLEIVAATHPFTMELKGSVITWKFININLPDSSSNEPGSHGFVAYRIKPQATLQVGDSILNKAGIYFDYNPAVITNTDVLRIVSNNIVTGLPSNPILDKSIFVYPNPVTNSSITIKNNSGQQLKHWRLINGSGTTIVEDRLLSSADRVSITIPRTTQTGFYVLQLLTSKAITYKKIMIINE